MDAGSKEDVAGGTISLGEIGGMLGIEVARWPDQEVDHWFWDCCCCIFSCKLWNVDSMVVPWLEERVAKAAARGERTGEVPEEEVGVEVPELEELDEGGLIDMGE